MRCKPAITTVSLGQAGLHDIQDKLREVARNGFEAIELFYDDLEAFARKQSGNANPSRDDIQKAAREIRDLCQHLHLTVLNLQPFRFYEGLADRKERDRILDEVLPIWFDVVHILGADAILIPSNFLPPDPVTGAARTVGDLDIIVDDLRAIADRGAKEPRTVRFAYEALAWGTHVNTWEQAWEIVQLVDRPNFGLAIDTFNVAGAIYADPATRSGTTGDSARADLLASLQRLAATVDLSRLFIVQIADGERLESPLQSGHPFYVPGQPSRMNWSRNARLFLCEEERGGYLPVVEILQTLLNMGWDGWLAYEIFSRTLADPNPKTPSEHASRSVRSWRRLQEILMPSKPYVPLNRLEAPSTSEKLSLVLNEKHKSVILETIRAGVQLPA
ncbi:hypothetical protein VTN31DRAFT_733 [Thermomyces dupontii]|uniref:uncharacterized protein n=1 Tax=Talaromyces thermophilus TaxID=28565 RepID=UPI00374298CE